MSIVKDFLLGTQVKAAGVNDLPFPRWGSTSLFDLQPRRTNLARLRIAVGDGLDNSAAFAVTVSLGRAFAEPTIREYDYQDGQDELVDVSPASDLLSRPNPYMESDDLWLYATAAIASEGDAYLHKVRNTFGEPIQLWPLYPTYIEPVTKTGSEFIDYYEYTIPGGQKAEIPVEDLVHLRWLPNRDDHRRGWAPLKSVISEIMTDVEAANFSVSLLHNLGIPGVVLAPRDPADALNADPSAIASEFRSKFTGSKRGEPFVSTVGMDVQMVSFSPQQMDLTDLRRLPEERISAVLGWPAILAGLGAGLTATSGRGESKTLRENATESTLVPLWRLIGKQLSRQLLPEWTDETTRSLKFDLTEVRSLSDDQDQAVNRIDTAIQGGWATVAEGRRVLNLPVEDEHEIFLRKVSQIPIGMDEEATSAFEMENEDEGTATGGDEAEG